MTPWIEQPCTLPPILLTAAAAILGMIPIAPTVFLGHDGYSIMPDWRSPRC